MRKSFPPSGVLETTVRLWLKWKLWVMQFFISFKLALLNINELRDLRLLIYTYNKKINKLDKKTH